jgi:hypothetical protein
MIHTEFTKFFCAEYFKTESIEQGGSLAKMRGIQQCFIIIQNRCVRATDEIYRMVNETAGHRPGTLKEFRAQEIALEGQVRLLERSKFEPIGSRQEEIAKKFCRNQIRDEGTKLNMATQTAIGFALSRLLDDETNILNIKKVFSTCRDKFCSINGAPVGRIIDESTRQERAMLAQTETKSKASLGGRNGPTDKSDGSNPKYDKLKKDLTLALRTN